MPVFVDERVAVLVLEGDERVAVLVLEGDERVAVLVLEGVTVGVGVRDCPNKEK